MSSIYLLSDPDYFDAMTSESLRWAQIATNDVEPSWGLGAITMGDDAEAEDAASDSAPPVAMMLQLPPGGVIERHAHECFRIEIVVLGSVEVGDGRTLRPGDVVVSRPREFYGPHVAGPDGCLSVEIFATRAGLVPLREVSADPAATLHNRRVVEAVGRARAGTGPSEGGPIRPPEGRGPDAPDDLR